MSGHDLFEDFTTDEKYVGRRRLKSGHAGKLFVLTHQIVEKGRSAAPVTDDKNRRFLDWSGLKDPMISDTLQQPDGDRKKPR